VIVTAAPVATNMTVVLAASVLMVLAGLQKRRLERRPLPRRLRLRRRR
jgi:hypothetical protein